MVLTTTLKDNTKTEIKDYLETVLTYGAIGDDNTTPVASNTELNSEIFRKAVDNFDKSAGSSVTASMFIATTEANDFSISEAGWLDEGETIIDNCNAITGWTDSADMTVSLNTTTYRTSTGSINLTKDATSSATASTSKTTTSLDFTGKNLIMFLYIKDSAALAKLSTSNCLDIRLGSDSSNYYQWQKDAADLVVGWNCVNNLNTSNASTTGSPVIASSDYTYIGLTATGSGITWSAGDFIMDDIKAVAGDLQTHNTLTAINKTDDIQVYLDTTITITVTET